MHGLEPDAWRDFFVAAAGIGAALAGLVFVAFSINLREILRFEGVLLVSTLGGLAAGVIGAWVLLVEILR